MLSSQACACSVCNSRGIEYQSSYHTGTHSFLSYPTACSTPFFYRVSPPDFTNRLPNGNLPPPNVEGLPDGWVWRQPRGYPPGYTNPGDPGAVWVPDEGWDSGYEGEQGHWDRFPEPNALNNKQKFPPNPEWGRGNQRNSLGVYNPKTGQYEPTSFSSKWSIWNSILQTGKTIGAGYIFYRAFKIIISPACGPLAPVCALSPY